MSQLFQGSLKQWKGTISKRIRFSPWQKSFYDHIIRDEVDYHRIVEYIDNNPEKWSFDRLYPEAGKDTP